MDPQLPPAGWYTDPTSPQAQRYWDGAVWTRDTRLPATLGSAARSERAAVGTPLPASQWSITQWTHVLLSIGIPLAVLAGVAVLVFSGPDTNNEPEQTALAFADPTSTTVSTTTSAAPDETTTTTRRSASTTSTRLNNPTRLEAGVHAVGTEIAPGIYRVSVHWARLDQNMDVIDNDLTISGVSIMNVLATDSFIELSGAAMPVALLPSLDPIEGGFDQGTYLVGADIAPGTYRVRALSTGTAYAARLRSDLSVIEAEQNDELVIVELTPEDFALRYTGTLEPVE